jgi:hypothetical protein
MRFRVFVLLAPLISATLSLADGGLIGRWEMVTDFSGRQIAATLVLTEPDEGEIEGRWISQAREMALSAIELEGETVAFDREIPGGRLLHFQGRLVEDTLEGSWSGALGEMACSGTRAAADAAEPEVDGIPDQHDRPIVERDGRRLLWANEDEAGEASWFDVTGATVDPEQFQHGIGKDTIDSIDAPVFVGITDERLAARGVDQETDVLGVEIDGIARAYPVWMMDRHEVVNDRFGEKAFAVLW